MSLDYPMYMSFWDAFSLVLNIIYKAGLLEELNKNPFGHPKVSYLEEGMGNWLIATLGERSHARSWEATTCKRQVRSSTLHDSK